MFSDREALKSVFDAAFTAVRDEDKLLRGHCENPCGYHHGIGFVTEPILVYLIFRSLIGKTPGYKIRLEQPYPSDARCQGDLILLRDGRWAACVEAKWLTSPDNVNLATKDMERMRQKLGAEVGKFLLGFWVKDPRNGASIDQWLNSLAHVPGVDRLWTGTFKTHWYKADEAEPLLVEVEAGLTLFEEN